MAERNINLPEARHDPSIWPWPGVARAVAAIPPSRWLAPMLLSLHASLLFAGHAYLARGFMLSHICLFLLWQPLLRREAPLDLRLATSVLVLAGALLLFDNPWIVALWLSILGGLAASTLTAESTRPRRWPGVVALLYPPAMLFAWVLPSAIGVELPGEVAAVALYGLPLPLLVSLLTPAQAARPRVGLLDYLYGVFATLLLLLLALAVFAVMAAAQLSYAWALAQSLVGVAALLFLVGWLWNPRAGTGGVGLLASRYLLSVGMPFEDFARRLANLAEHTHDPETLVGEALAELEGLKWIRGGCWRTAHSSGCFGVSFGHVYEFEFHGLTMIWYTERAVAPVLALHLRLVTQLIGYFQAAKAREQAMRENAYSQAIAETGAQLTHDMKNTLQSMSALLSAVESSPEGDDGRLVRLLRRQMPQLSERLTRTLEHLKQPAATVRPSVAASDWWRDLQARYAVDDIAFHGEAASDEEVHQALFDSVADNLLVNALRKRRSQPGLAIEARISRNPPALEIVDDGEPVPELVARGLFANSLSTEGGLGVGLYLAARQARRAGYCLSLEENRRGRVRFLLAEISAGRCLDSSADCKRSCG